MSEIPDAGVININNEELLVKAGYSTVYNVTGGIVLWIEAGLPIEPVKND